MPDYTQVHDYVFLDEDDQLGRFHDDEIVRETVEYIRELEAAQAASVASTLAGVEAQANSETEPERFQVDARIDMDNSREYVRVFLDAPDTEHAIAALTELIGTLEGIK